MNEVTTGSGSDVNKKLPDEQEVANRVTSESISDLKADKGDGFKFAVATIVAFSTIGYNIYNYMINNPVNDFLFFLS